MSLYAALQEREARGEPVRAGLIGAGKFGTMFLASARTTPGLQVLGIADLSPDRARDALARAAFEPDRGQAPSAAAAAASGDTWITDDVAALVSAPEVDVVLEATGNPYAGVSHALLAGEHGKHLVMVTVEADALCGPELCRRVEAGGGIYSFAYGDQPALICELVDWARATGLEVVCAGKGTKHLPEYHHSTPETVWGHYGFTEEEAQQLNPQMFNSFLDGTKSAIEMAAVANATGLRAPAGRPRVPTRRREPPRHGPAAARGGGHPPPLRHRRGGLQPRARRRAGARGPALGRVRGGPRAVGLRRHVLGRVRRDHRPDAGATAPFTGPTTTSASSSA